ncbi:DeoR family transcriptional regulator, partial [Pseudokineococcus marinus]
MSTLAGRGPLAETRRQHLLLALRRDGVVRVSDLTEALGVTPVTVRRDIARLERDGLVRRVHGGAALPVPAPRLRVVLLRRLLEGTVGTAALEEA